MDGTNTGKLLTLGHAKWGHRTRPLSIPSFASRLQRLSRKYTPAYILSAGSTNELSFVRSLGRRRIGNQKVVVVASPAELISTHAGCATSGDRFMVQAIVPGEDDAIFWYSAFWDGQSRERAWFTVQKLRQFPPGFGDGCFQQSVQVPAVLRASRRLLQHFHYRRLVMVEFKRHAADGSYYLIEINPRTVSGNQLGISAGVDLPWIAYCELAGLEPPNNPCGSFRTNVRYVHEEWDVQAFAALHRSSALTLAGWVRSLRNTQARALFSWDDPLPFLIGIWRFLMIGLRRVFATVVYRRPKA